MWQWNASRGLLGEFWKSSAFFVKAGILTPLQVLNMKMKSGCENSHLATVGNEYKSKSQQERKGPAFQVKFLSSWTKANCQTSSFMSRSIPVYEAVFICIQSLVGKCLLTEHALLFLPLGINLFSLNNTQRVVGTEDSSWYLFNMQFVNSYVVSPQVKSYLSLLSLTKYCLLEHYLDIWRNGYENSLFSFYYK